MHGFFLEMLVPFALMTQYNPSKFDSVSNGCYELSQI